MSAFRQGVMVAVFAVVILLIVRLGTVSDGPLERAERYRTEVAGTCHSLDRFFVGDVTRISALFGVEIVTGQEDWPDVARLMEDLAERHGMSFLDSSISRPGVETLSLSVCAPGQPVILVNEIEWDFGSADDRRTLSQAEPYISFAIYGDMAETVWQPVASDLFAMLRARWPSQIRFRDQNSRVTSRRPAFLYPEP